MAGPGSRRTVRASAGTGADARHVAGGGGGAGGRRLAAVRPHRPAPNTNPAETAFTPGNVAGLAVAWTGQFGEADETEAGPVVAGGSVYVTGFDGNLSVFDASDVGDAGSTTTPALVGDTLLASTQATPDPNTSGVVAAFPAHGCGAAVGEPLWTGINFADGFESSPVAAGKVMLDSTDNTGAPDVPARSNLYVLALPES